MVVDGSSVLMLMLIETIVADRASLAFGVASEGLADFGGRAMPAMHMGLRLVPIGTVTRRSIKDAVFGF